MAKTRKQALPQVPWKYDRWNSSAEPGPVIHLTITEKILRESICNNRRQCVIATAIKREILGNDDHGYVNVGRYKDGRELASWNQSGLRYRALLPQEVVEAAHRYDETAQWSGPRRITLPLLESLPIPPKASKERMHQVYLARARLVSEMRRRGERPPAYDRWKKA